MNKYDPHWNYRRCFQEIDEIIWGYINSTLPGDRERYKESAVKIADRTKKIITAYVDKHAAMMIGLISEGHFDEFPLPRLSLPDESADHSDNGGENSKRPLQTTVGKFLFPIGFSCGALFGLLLAKFILPV